MVYRLALLSNGNSRLSDNAVLRYVSVTLSSHHHAQSLAQDLNAVICSWRLA